jgi:hypothetical protein
MKLRDRFGSRAETAPPTTPWHLGRWWIEHEDGSPPTPLLPDRDGTWSLVDPRSGAVHAGSTFVDAWPGEPNETALLALGRQLAEQSPSWATWIQQSPLAPDLDRWVERQPLEDHIERELHHLEHVCRAPQTHIELHAERVALGRARKLDRRAPQWLATHSEDWAARRVFGVMPRRLLALVREPQWDLYENRVAARLVDHLVEWLRLRVSTLRQIRDEVLAALDQDNPEGTHQRQRRLYTLWGDAFISDQLGAALRAALTQAEQWLHRLLGLMDSPLYRQVPGQARVEPELRTTNLLVNDDRYRGVARLWQAWARSAVVRRSSPLAWETRARGILDGFESWCTLLVIRACAQLGLEPLAGCDSTPLHPGSRIALSGGFELHRTECGNLRLCDGADARLELIPLLQMLEQAGNNTATKSRVDPLIEASAPCACWRVVLHLAASAESSLAGVGNPPHPEACAGAIDFIRVSPFALDSVERVSRAIRWVVWAPRMLAYPPPLKRALEGWPSGELTSYPSPTQRRELEQIREQARRELAGAEAERETIVAELRSPRAEHRRAEWKQRKSQKERELEPLRRRVAELTSYADSMERAERTLQALASCPLCQAPGALEPRQHACFLGRCAEPSCGATWELRRNDDGERIPVLVPGSARGLDWPSSASPRVVDRWVGCDVLALPIRSDAGELSFVAPRRSSARGRPAALGGGGARSLGASPFSSRAIEASD